MDELFKAKAELVHEREFDLRVSYLEVYNESVQDLLVNTADHQGAAEPLQVLDSKNGLMVLGLTVRRIADAAELFELLDEGNRNRTQHRTGANAESRSHAVVQEIPIITCTLLSLHTPPFSLLLLSPVQEHVPTLRYLQVYIQMDVIATGERIIGKLSMIDLAGSDRRPSTDCNGARFTERSYINKSLLALRSCMNALADGLPHVSYRDSKITHLLKDSLGGACHTVMIANISPARLCYQDTHSTLKFANCAKHGKAHLKRTVVVGHLHVSQYVTLLEERSAAIKQFKAEIER